MKHDSSKTPLTIHTPSMADHTHGTSKTKTPDTPAKPRMMLSPKATASLAKFMGMSDDVEGTPQKRHGGSASREVPSKKAKVDDDSVSYSSPSPSKNDVPKKEVKKRKTKKKMPSSDDESSYASAKERVTPRSPAETKRLNKLPGQTGIVLASGRKIWSLWINTADEKGCAPRSWLAVPTTIAMLICWPNSWTKGNWA